MPDSPSKHKTRMLRIAGISCALALSGLMTSCDVGSPDSVSRSVRANIGGFYSACDNNGSIPKSNRSITSLNVIQTGDRLQAIDNQGALYKGTIGAVFDTTATFTLEGNTASGSYVVMAGNFSVGSGSATMTGTWIEGNINSALCAVSDGGQSIEEPVIDRNDGENPGIDIGGNDSSGNDSTGDQDPGTDPGTGSGNNNSGLPPIPR